ncbi:MAG: hypothetical protein AAB602_02505 [Patescibacteria group bacterium]
MKPINFLLVLFVIICAALFVFFYVGMKMQISNSFSSQPSGASTINVSPNNPTRTTVRDGTNNTSGSSTGKFIPTNFKGPTGQPTIIGPSGPPPNY